MCSRISGEVDAIRTLPVQGSFAHHSADIHVVGGLLPENTVASIIKMQGCPKSQNHIHLWSTGAK